MICAVRSCRTNSANGDVFSFPEDDSLKQSWLRACRLQSSDISPNHGLCHIHFKSDEIQRDPSSGLVRPLSGSVPSLFLEADLDAELFRDNRLSQFSLKKNEVEIEASIQDRTSTLLDDNANLQKKTSAYLKKISNLERDRLRRFFEIAKQKSVVEQLLRYTEVTPFQLKKLNKVVDCSESGLILRKNGVATSKELTVKPAAEDCSQRISNLVKNIEAVKFASSTLSKETSHHRTDPIHSGREEAQPV